MPVSHGCLESRPLGTVGEGFAPEAQPSLVPQTLILSLSSSSAPLHPPAGPLLGLCAFPAGGEGSLTQPWQWRGPSPDSSGGGTGLAVEGAQPWQQRRGPRLLFSATLAVPANVTMNTQGEGRAVEKRKRMVQGGPLQCGFSGVGEPPSQGARVLSRQLPAPLRGPYPHFHLCLSGQSTSRQTCPLLPSTERPPKDGTGHQASASSDACPSDSRWALGECLLSPVPGGDSMVGSPHPSASRTV